MQQTCAAVFSARIPFWTVKKTKSDRGGKIEKKERTNERKRGNSQLMLFLGQRTQRCIQMRVERSVWFSQRLLKNVEQFKRTIYLVNTNRTEKKSHRFGTTQAWVMMTVSFVGELLFKRRRICADSDRQLVSKKKRCSVSRRDRSHYSDELN